MRNQTNGKAPILMPLPKIGDQPQMKTMKCKSK